jgi:hypothetical protein
MAITSFLDHIQKGYTFKGDKIRLGSAMHNKEVVKGAEVYAALKTLNRHGLIAGATGTGKTKTLQGIAESLSAAGVPSLVMDMKGDLSGLAAAGGGHPKIDERMELLEMPWEPIPFPCEFLTISDEPGLRLRATISEFGPVLLSKILDLNATQSGVMSLIFKYADDNELPLLDIKDLRKMLQYVSNEGKEKIEAEYGRVSPASVGAIMRKLLEVEQQGADKFFGEISFDVQDLMRQDKNGYGFINVLRLTDMQGKPKLFSTFMLCLLAEIYSEMPEKGDADKPELVIFIDEAHLIFRDASKALMEQLDTIVKLIRSKGVGLIFVTQDPTDVPDNILGQLGLKVQHALRAFTEKDRKAIKATAENYPISDFYKTNELITQLGIGEAFITLLNEKGIPTPLAHTMLCAPRSRMDILEDKELKACVAKSDIADRYNKDVDSESAYELLTAKLKKSKKLAEVEEKKAPKKRTASKSRTQSVGTKLLKSLLSSQNINTVLRGVLGILKKR